MNHSSFGFGSLRYLFELSWTQVWSSTN